jgi:ABC-type bacteriocin/lantibiotic exporter with double-glycine peptidase domain
VPLDELRQMTSTDRDGVDALAVTRAAQQYGLSARGVVADLDDLEQLPPATILHWEFTHFVVFERLRRNGVQVVDPSLGRRRLSMEAFRRSYTGVAITFEPGEDFQPSTLRTKGTWRYLRPLLGQSRGLSRVLVGSVLLRLLALALPLLTGLLVNEIVPRNDRHLLLVTGAAMGAVVAYFFLATLLRSHLLLQLRTRLDVSLTTAFVEHLVDLPYVFFLGRSAGDLMMRLQSNTVVREFLTTGTISALIDGSLASLYLVLLFMLSPPLAALVLVLGLLQVMVLLLARRRNQHLMSESLQVEAKSQSYTFELLAGIETLKAAGAERRAAEHWERLFIDQVNVALGRGRLDASVDSVMGTLQLGSPLAILVYGGFQVLNGSIALGTMLAAAALAAGFLEPLATLIQTGLKMQLLRSYMERINDVLDAPREQEGQTVATAPRLTGRIRADGVSFAYGGPLAPPVVKDVSLEVQPGQLLGIVGRSGSGKSTFAHLLLGLYLPTSGRILFDGRELTELDFRSLRGQIGIVTQRPYLFGATIRQNIALSNPAMPHQAVVEAAKLACIHDDIVAMPMGYETLLVDGGASLSGGQQQRIALARALAHRPTILLLDEATSDLDGVTERLVHRNLSALGCTRIVIAHRLSTIVDADRILVMEDGRIVQHGTHEELMVLPGAYRQQVRAQLRSTSPGAQSEIVELWHLVTDARAVPVVDRPGPDAAETPVPTGRGPDAAKTPVAHAAKAPAANGQGPAPAKRAGPSDAGPGTAEVPTVAAAKALATARPAGEAKKPPAPEVKEPPPKAQVQPGPEVKARPAAEAKVPPAPRVKAPPAARPKTPVAAEPKVPPVTAAKAPPATEAKVPPAREARPTGPARVAPAAAAETRPVSEPRPSVAPPEARSKATTAKPAPAIKTPPAASKVWPGPTKPQSAKAGPEVPAAKAALPPAARVEVTPEAAVAPPTAGPAKDAETRPSTALARVSQATRRESDSLGESGRPSESVAGQPKVADRAGALPGKALTLASAGPASTVATRRPIPGMAMPSTPPPAGPSPLRRLAKRLGRKKAAAGGMPATAAPIPRAEPQVLPSAKEGRPTPEVAKVQSSPPQSERPAPPAATPAAAGPGRAMAPPGFRQTRPPEARPPGRPAPAGQPAAEAGQPRPGTGASGAPAAPKTTSAATAPPMRPAASKPPAPAKVQPPPMPKPQEAAEATARSPRLPSERPTPATDTGATAQPAAPPGGPGDAAAKSDTVSETRPDQPARLGKRPADRQAQPPAAPAKEPSSKDRPTPAPPPPSRQRQPPGRKPAPASARPPETLAAAEAPNPSRVTPVPAGPAAPVPMDAPRPAASIKPSPSTPSAPAAKDVAVPAAGGTRAAKDQAATGGTERPSDQDKRSRRAWNLRRYIASRRPETPQPQAPVARGALFSAEYEHLSRSIESLTEALGGQSIKFYERDLPQIAASEIAKRVRADVTVLLLDNGQGIMEVSGDIGLTPDERQLSVEYRRDVMRELFWAGVGLIEDTDRVRGALAGIPGGGAETLILVPLVHRRLGFGVLMAGRDRSTTGKPAEVFTDRDVQALMGFADAIAESLHAAVQLRSLKGQLKALENG